MDRPWNYAYGYWYGCWWFDGNIWMDCIGNISAIIEYYSNPKHSPEPYNMADLLVFLWQFRILAEAKNDETIVKEIDKLVGKKPKTLPDSQWLSVLSAFELRKEQLKERLHEIDELMSIRDTSETVLRNLLQSRE